jgi:hypothetical protein
MKIEWIAIEIIAVLIEGLTKVYFLNNRFISRYNSIIPKLLALFCLIGWGLAATFLNLPPLLYDSTTYVIVLAYLLLIKHGSLAQKIFGTVLIIALDIGSSLIGAGLASVITNVSVEHTLMFQDSARMLAIILIKTIQVILFYTLAKNHYSLRSLQKRPVIVLTWAAIMVVACLLFLLFNLSEFNEQSNHVLIWLAVGLMFILIGIFAMYEMFIREETRSLDLSTRLQRLELESQFFRELDVMLSDLRTWRHEYKNNLVALRALIEECPREKALEYLEKMSVESFQESSMLQTGNTALDAVVSSKLMLARRNGVDVSIHAVYPEINNIEDNDLCAIAGNLLDNAIEACERMSITDQPQFISFSLLVKGKNLALSILNSYVGEIRQTGDRFLTLKDTKFHGIGIQYVDSIVDKYQGHVLRKHQDGVFETHVLLPLISVKEGTLL